MKTEMVGIEIENLHLAFGPTKVLTGVNLSIKPGEFFAFLGPSGSGKSTLLRSLAGFGPRPSGAIRIATAAWARATWSSAQRAASASRPGRFGSIMAARL